jgi:hypothetical protein
MKTILTTCMLALAFISYNAFSQNTSEPDATLLGRSFTPGQQPGTISPGSDDVATDALRNGTFCDNFNVPNTSTVTGWTEQSGNWQIFNNMLKTPGNTTWEYVTVDGSSQADGCITGRAIYEGPGRPKFVGLVARYNNESSRILFKIQDQSSGGNWNSWWIYTPSGALSSTGLNLGTDAIIQLEYAGTNITVRIDVDRDGTWDNTSSYTTSYTSAGLCGVGAYDNAYLDDYCCGAECGMPPVVPLSNTGLYIALALILGFVVIRIYRMR